MIKGFEEQEKRNYYLNLYSQVNAIGSAFGGKKFKEIDPFKEEENINEEEKRTVTKAQREEILNLFEKNKE